MLYISIQQVFEVLKQQQNYFWYQLSFYIEFSDNVGMCLTSLSVSSCCYFIYALIFTDSDGYSISITQTSCPIFIRSFLFNIYPNNLNTLANFDPLNIPSNK